MHNFIHPVSPEEYIAIARAYEQIILQVDAELVMIDTFSEAALDAANRLKVDYIKLSPNTLKEVASAAQGIRIFKRPV